MPAELPRGTVTFLFSDVEGSTKLLDQLGDTAYAALLATHHTVLRSTFTAWGGVEVDNQGDAFFVAFSGAQEALLCAADAQRLLAAQYWPGNVHVRVRMGVHTGPAVLEDQRYVGLDVHAGARICAAAHGCQIVVSEATRVLAQGRLPSGLGFRDLGEHRLKDLPQPQRLAQLLVDGLPQDFPPPRSLEPANTLPTQLTSFVGRTHEAVELRRLVTSARLVTLTGPGGMGKTRLGLHVADVLAAEFRDGVHFVPLASVEDSSLVASAVATALGLDTGDSRGPRERVLDHLADKRLLLLLDNFEHVQAAAPFVAALLTAAPRVVVLATSRSPLHVYGEREFPLQPLSPPPPALDLEQVARSDAVALFVDRAQAVSPAFRLTPQNAPEVVEVVRRLDGLPLAIELAAARVKVLPPRALLRKLTDRLDLLAQRGSSRPSRHETLDAAIGWSYDLLTPQLQRTFTRFAVFAGPVGIERAEPVCTDDDGHDVVDDLAALVDHSLLVAADRAGEPALAMLRTVRAFGLARLRDLGEERLVRDQHARTMLALAEEVEPALVGSEAKEQLDRLDAEHDDLRAALRYAIGEEDVPVALSLLATMWRYWQMRGHLSEARQAAEQVLRLPGVEQHPEAFVRALEAAGGTAYWQGDLDSARRFYEQAVDVCRTGADRAALANALYNLSFAHSVTRSDPQAARRCAEESLQLYRALGDRDGAARTSFALGNAAYFQDDVAAARDAYADCLALASGSGGGYLEGWGSYMLALAEQGLGRAAEAEQLYRRACRRFSATGDASGTVMALNALADVAALRGDKGRAARLAAAAGRLEASSGATMATFALEQEQRNGLRDLRRVAPDDWAAGEALELDGAVALALAPTDQAAPPISSATSAW